MQAGEGVKYMNPFYWQQPGFKSTLFGEKHGFARLKENQVLAIRAMYAHGASKRHLGLQYNVNPSTINKVVTRETWKHL